ncbi:hypothetical protein J7K92_00760 [bacterium]|nr:hypothetical protein [bacterium]
MFDWRFETRDTVYEVRKNETGQKFIVEKVAVKRKGKGIGDIPVFVGDKVVVDETGFRLFDDGIIVFWVNPF